jgi:hypothetical protein
MLSPRYLDKNDDVPLASFTPSCLDCCSWSQSCRAPLHTQTLLLNPEFSRVLLSTSMSCSAPLLQFQSCPCPWMRCGVCMMNESCNRLGWFLLSRRADQNCDALGFLFLFVRDYYGRSAPLDRDFEQICLPCIVVAVADDVALSRVCDEKYIHVKQQTIEGIFICQCYYLN